MDIRWHMERLCDSSAEVFLCLGVFVDFLDLKFSGLVLMSLELVGTFKWDTQGKNSVVVDVDVNEDELERNKSEGHLTQSSATGLITIQDHNLV